MRKAPGTRGADRLAVRRGLIIFAAIFSACGGGTRADSTGAGGGGLGGYGGGSGCGLDSDCASGMVCQGCDAAGPKTCLPGCREDAQCGGQQVCSHDVACTSCPCPPGWCVADPCLDLDGDGYVETSDADAGCPAGKLYGDCDDLNPRVNPGRAEVCNDGVDDNCDGKRDSADPQCQTCAGGRGCTDVFSCSIGQEQCDAGCCTACPVQKDPACAANECLFPGAPGLDGCPGAQVCRTCASSCPSYYDQVCGTDYVTYQNDCFALAAGQQVLHRGSCWWAEGVACDGPPGSTLSCGPSGSFYCRDTCPTCDGLQPLRCTGVGNCLSEVDCPAGLFFSCDDGGTAAWSCVEHRCTPACGADAGP